MWNIPFAIIVCQGEKYSIKSPIFAHTKTTQMSKLIIETTAYSKVLQCAHDSDSSAFYVGEDKMAVSGGRLTAKAGLCCILM